MLTLALVMVVVALLVGAFAVLWQLVEAFRESVVWGICSLLVPFANLVFMFAHWERGKGPFLAHLLALLLLLGSYSVVLGYERNGGKLPDLRKFGLASQPSPAPARTGVLEAGPLKAEKDAQLQIKLVNLHTRETELLQRKAELKPGDRAGATALAEEIRKYNADLQPVLLQVRDSGGGVAH